jgi:hypothetical protein
LFNLLILGVGLVIANFWFGSLKAQWTMEGGTVDYQKLFLVPTGLALVAGVLLLFLFKPPASRPAETKPEGALPH